MNLTEQDLETLKRDCTELIRIHNAGIRYLAVLKLVETAFIDGLSIFNEKETLAAFYREVGTSFTNFKACVNTERKLRKLVTAARLKELHLDNEPAKKTAEKALEIVQGPSLWDQYSTFFDSASRGKPC